ncbi:hypothetical protein [Streptomyces sp. B15]|uniref:hypothetical protein n=1 Tax=Streptomyces sp. B15 TaxID=1537797 RepID=UPI001B35C178|nr:hypothetical protein [Streptomyces sp. B15]MBQ1122607.1 hypothetical protein [Streptomyces sp. B15]
MTWFAVDDRAHSHPKIMAASNAAVGLWVRCGSYVAQHLTDGVVPGSVARMYGSAVQIRKLVAVGLWHAHGHDCGSCPQPPEGDYVMHDYATPGSGNQTRSEVEARKKREAEKKRRQRGTKQGPQGPGPGAAPRSQPDAPRAEPIPGDWTPSVPDRETAAQDIVRLGPAASLEATEKFIRHHQAKGTTAVDFGPLWVTWMAAERNPPPQTGGGVVVPLRGAGAPVTGTDARVQEHAQLIKEMERRASQ